jgi:hypothetical protein
MRNTTTRITATASRGGVVFAATVRSGERGATFSTDRQVPPALETAGQRHPPQHPNSGSTNTPAAAESVFTRRLEVERSTATWTALAGLEYIVVHEMTHDLERNHGERFTALMDGFRPDWRAQCDQLNTSPRADAQWPGRIAIHPLPP